MAILYQPPQNWIFYDQLAIAQDMIEAKASIMSLVTTPYQRDWVDALQEIQLKREVEGTSRIEGADFTPDELRVALEVNQTPEQLFTRSQRQARAAAGTYRWIRELPKDRPVDETLITEIHRHIVTSCDDDHCEPGALRRQDQNVTFGTPRHRGVEGGQPCQTAFDDLIRAVQHEFNGHDRLIQALALHYHFAAMHPFSDGNGRTARVLEAWMLQKAGLRDTAFIAMSNYYNDEKPRYLATLADVRQRNHDLTPFLSFGLQGIAIQCKRLHDEIRRHMQKILFRDTANALFQRLKSKRKRVIQERQRKILHVLLEVDSIDWFELIEKTIPIYNDVKKSTVAIQRDIQALLMLEAIDIRKVGEKKWSVSVRLDWPSRITETEFFEKVQNMPKAKTYNFLT